MSRRPTTAEHARAFLEDEAVRPVREAVLRLTTPWWSFVGVPLGLFWGTRKFLDGALSPALALAVALTVGVALVLWRSRDTLVRSWAVLVAMALAVVAAWLQFGGYFGTGVLMMATLTWAVAMLGPRAGWQTLGVLVVVFAVVAWGVPAGVIPFGGSDSWRRVSEWVNGGITGFTVATLILIVLGRLRAALSDAIERERASLRESAQRRVLLDETRAALELAQRRAVVGTLAAGYAHDINNALTAATLAVDELSTHHPDDPEAAEAARRSLRHISAQARELVRLGRGATDGRPVSDLATAVRQATALIRPVLPGGVTVVLDLSAEGTIPLAAPRLEQALLNLALNARDAMPRGGTLTIRTAPHPQGLFVEVGDTGDGIPDAVRARIFEPFFTTKAAQGSGLGLVMVQQIVDSCGGAITIESRPGEGTRVGLRFPRVA